MTLTQVKNLKPGDKVYWTDPDDGLCSKVLVIKKITIRGDIVRIGQHGYCLDCFAKELSFPGPVISRSPNKNWKNNAIQFPRLIAELEAVGAFVPSIVHDLAEAMDLTPAEIFTLVSRAQAEWDKIKQKI
jgi:hypothetical protein